MYYLLNLVKEGRVIEAENNSMVSGFGGGSKAGGALGGGEGEGGQSMGMGMPGVGGRKKKTRKF